jgi:protein-disulfide isomerase
VNTARLPLVLSVAALVTAALSWLVTGRQIQDLRDAQRTLVSEVAANQNAAVINIKGASSRGSDRAVVALVEFTDYECPFCIRHYTQTMPRIDSTYVQTGRLLYVFQDFPVDALHPAAIKAHEAGRCAADQGRFWEMHATLFSPAGSHTPELLEKRASDAGLKMEAYRECVSTGRYTDAVKRSVKNGQALGIQGTPSFVIGVRDPATDEVRVLQAFSGAHPFEYFARAIETALKKMGV